MTARSARLSRRYPRLEEVCELNLVDMDVRSPEFERGDFLIGRPWIDDHENFVRPQTTHLLRAKPDVISKRLSLTEHPGAEQGQRRKKDTARAKLGEGVTPPVDPGRCPRIAGTELTSDQSERRLGRRNPVLGEYRRGPSRPPPT